MQVAMPQFRTVVASVLAWSAIGQLGAAPAQVIRRITLPDDQHFAPTGRQLLTVSPDGRDVVYVANGRLYRRETSERHSMPIPGTEIPQGILSPVFSPDGQSIAFWSGADQTLKRIPVHGGAPVTICQTAPPFGVSWATTESILFGAGPNGVMRVPASGGVAETLIAVSSGTLADAPQLLPGGDAVLFTILTPPPTGVIGINPFEHGEVVVQSIRSGERRTVLKPADEAHYASSGYLLYGLAGTVFAAAFDLKGLVVTGEAKPLLDDVRTAGPTQFALSDSGALAFIPGRQGSVQLELIDRSGRRKAPGTLPDSVFALRVSPSGRQVTFDTYDGVVWIADLDHLSLKHALTSGGNNRFPMWSGDGQRIFYTSERDGIERLFSQNINGKSSGELLTQPVRSAESWSPQHEMLSFITFKAGGDYDIWGYSVPDKKVVPLVEIPGSAQHSSRFSPDGRWLAYASNETGRWEVFVQSFPITGTRLQITIDGGGHPLWSPDSKEIFIDRAGRMFSIRVRTEPTFAADPPLPLPISGFIQGEARRQYDMTPDGKQFLMMFPAVSHFDVAANWSLLPKRVR
jgi:dipeptidyl aminopeptidase/acylaminoacyl peptidase